MDKYYREIAPKIDTWEYKEGIKIGMDIVELKETHKDWFKGHYKYDGGSAYNKTYNKHYGDRFEAVEFGDDNKIGYYKFQVVQNSYALNDDVKKTLDKLRTYFGADMLFDEMAFNETMHYYVIRSPYAQNSITVEVLDIPGGRQIKILKKIKLWQSKSLIPNTIDISEMAYNLDHLDRYTGTYTMNNVRYDISREAGMSLLNVKVTGADKTNFYYSIIKEKGADVFTSYYFLKDNKKSYYEDKQKLKLTFDLQEDILSLKLSDGKVYQFIKQY